MQSNLHAISHSLSLLQTNSMPFKDMSVEIQNMGENSRAHVVILLMPSFLLSVCLCCFKYIAVCGIFLLLFYFIRFFVLQDIGLCLYFPLVLLIIL